MPVSQPAQLQAARGEETDSDSASTVGSSQIPRSAPATLLVGVQQRADEEQASARPAKRTEQANAKVAIRMARSSNMHSRKSTREQASQMRQPLVVQALVQRSLQLRLCFLAAIRLSLQPRLGLVSSVLGRRLGRLDILPQSCLQRWVRFVSGRCLWRCACLWCTSAVSFFCPGSARSHEFWWIWQLLCSCCAWGRGVWRRGTVCVWSTSCCGIWGTPSCRCIQGQRIQCAKCSDWPGTHPHAPFFLFLSHTYLNPEKYLIEGRRREIEHQQQSAQEGSEGVAAHGVVADAVE